MTNERRGLNLGIHVYGQAAILLGVIGLVWDDFAAVWQPVPEGVSHRGALAYAAAILFLCAGVAVQPMKTRAWGALALGVLYVPYALLWLRRVIGFPERIGTWSGFGEQLALVTAGLMAYEQFAGSEKAWSRTVALVCRVLFGLCFVSLALVHFGALKETAELVPKWMPGGQKFWAIATGVFHLMAGVAIGSGVQAKLAAGLLTTMIAIFGLFIWAPALAGSPRDHFVWCANAVNLALLGAAWVAADWARDGDGERQSAG
jgi:uncharacterized membrane protein YphA (DoxX/SURF4 family)